MSLNKTDIPCKVFLAIVCNSYDRLKPFNTKKIPLKIGLDTFTFENIVFPKIWLETFQTYPYETCSAVQVAGEEPNYPFFVDLINFLSGIN